MIETAATSECRGEKIKWPGVIRECWGKIWGWEKGGQLKSVVVWMFSVWDSVVRPVGLGNKVGKRN